VTLKVFRKPPVILKNVPKAARWKKNPPMTEKESRKKNPPMTEKESRKRNSVAAFGTIFRI
jgi:hypothetical protein